MPRPVLPAGLYAIVDASLGDPVRAGARLARAGCHLVQLRAKGWPEARVAEAAAALVAATRDTGCLVVVNDHPAVAAAVGAAGAHIGQDDAPGPRAARAVLGPDRLLGLSTHDLAQVRRASEEGLADYVGFGPVFASRTAKTAWRPRGVEALAAAVRASRVPVVAIGGVEARRLPALRAAGARHWAVVGALRPAYGDGPGDGEGGEAAGGPNLSRLLASLA